MVEQENRHDMTQSLSEIGMKLKGYETLTRVARFAEQRFKNDIIGTGRLLDDFLEGRDLKVSDLYNLCAVAGMFPDSAYYQTDRNFVLDAKHVGKIEDFSTFISENRIKIARKVREVLGLTQEGQH